MDSKRRRAKLITTFVCVVISIILLIYAIVRGLFWGIVASIIWIVSGIIKIKELSK